MTPSQTLLLPKAGKRILDLIHLLAASLWLGAFCTMFLLMLNNPLPLDFNTEILLVVMVDAIHEVALLAIPFLMLTGIAYGICTHWGFIKYNWVIVKWIGAIAMVVAAALMPYTPLTTGLMVLVATGLFALSLYKPWMKKKNMKKASSKAVS